MFSLSKTDGVIFKKTSFDDVSVLSSIPGKINCSANSPLVTFICFCNSWSVHTKCHWFSYFLFQEIHWTLLLFLLKSMFIVSLYIMCNLFLNSSGWVISGKIYFLQLCIYNIHLVTWILGLFFICEILLQVLCWFKSVCHHGDHYWDFCPGGLSLNQISVTHLMVGHLWMKSNELQRLAYMTGYQPR